MKPSIRAYSLAITISTAIMFFLWSYISVIASSNTFILLTVGILSAIGTYRSVLSAITCVFNEVEVIKKFVFGKYYLSGVWVGVYMSSNNCPVYYIENYFQSYESTIVKGRCYDHNKSYKGSWFSEDIVIDINKEKLIYNYYTDMNSNNFMNLGQASFNIHREQTGRTANKLMGYSKDLFSSSKYKTIEAKIFDGNRTKYKCIESDEELLNKAIDLHRNHENFFT